MRRLTTAALAATLFLGLTACGTNTKPDQPAAATTATSPSPAPVDTEAAAQACTNAVYAAVQDAKTADDLIRPPECASMTEDEYLDTVLAVVQQSNKAGQDDLRKAVEDAASAATPSP
ncbi:hypothetical protein GCM10010275_30110 [Streptomyces litmocidini]|uniref:hypothetical protein n=1 Tax=Streptomyces litmocidini TaxID=67318 RepID=UPI00167C4D71|nr:hypothetical protein [Streptomyces litmocidini]GGU91051.1 hypothetical protein GCM10010275_30110 [Streptomyces litmocidini]